MYDWPEIRSETDRLWTAISSELISNGLDAPARLKRIEHPSTLWTNPQLVVGQTCGWPYANRLRGKVFPFARFDYGRAGCPDGFYNSVFIGRTPSDIQYLQSPQKLLSVGKIAINGDDSQSGFHVFDEVLNGRAAKSIPQDQKLITGAHRNSVRAVAAGEAAVAAIDSVAFELAERFESDAFKEVVVLGHSQPKPGLPLITSLDHRPNAELLFKSVRAGLSELSQEVKNALLIKDVVAAHDGEYDVFMNS